MLAELAPIQERARELEANPDTVRNLVLSAPGVNTEMIVRVGINLANQPDQMSIIKTLIIGGFTGDPLKVFASLAYEAEITPLASFLVPAFIARIARFAAVLAIAATIRAILFKRLRRVGLIRLTLFIWVAFYLWFGYVFWDVA